MDAYLIGGLPRVLDPWLATEPSFERRQVVLSRVLAIADMVDQVINEWPAHQGRPNRRATYVAGADLWLVFKVFPAPPVRGIELIQILDE